MLSILPLLLVGLGLSFFVDNDDDSGAQPTTPEPGGGTGDGPEDDLLTFVQGIELGVLTGDGDTVDGPIDGTEGDDTITGAAGGDVLNGAGGNDQVVGDLGQDTITGGLGNDTLDGGGGADAIDGGPGADQIVGGSGNDSLFGADGADTVVGGAGNDVLDGTQGDLFQPTSPTDSIDPDNPADDERTMDLEGPIVEPPAPATGDQVLDGGAGNDTLIGDNADSLTGGEGADSFLLESSSVDPTAGSVVITDFDPLLDALTLGLDGFQEGDPAQDGFAYDVETRDLADDSGMEVLVQGVVVATLAGISESDGISISVVGENSGAANPGTFTNLGDGDDTAVADLSDDTVNGGAGNDSIEGSAGRDVLNGDGGNDTLNGGAGRDNLSGGTGNDQLDGGGNDETPVGAVVQERLDGGAGDDTLRTGDGFVALTGGAGTDEFEITRTEVASGPAADPFGVPVTEVTDLDAATEQVNIIFVNGDASAAPVPYTLVDAPDGSGVAVVIGGESYAFLTGVLAADAPVVTVTSAAV